MEMHNLFFDCSVTVKYVESDLTVMELSNVWEAINYWLLISSILSEWFSFREMAKKF